MHGSGLQRLEVSPFFWGRYSRNGYESGRLFVGGLFRYSPFPASGSTSKVQCQLSWLSDAGIVLTSFALKSYQSVLNRVVAITVRETARGPKLNRVLDQRE
jgi:hypothetical protein